MSKVAYPLKLAGPRDRRMIRRGLWQHQPEKLAEREGVRRAPRDGALGVQAFEVADLELQINSRRN